MKLSKEDLEISKRKVGGPSALLYLDISEVINNRYYSLINIPDVSALRSPFELSGDGTTAGPIRTPFGYEVGSGMFTINWMINNYGSTPFEFAKWEDIIEVAELINAYLDKMQKSEVKFSSEDNAYLVQAAQFAEEVTKLANKMILYYNVKDRNVSIFDRKKRQSFEDSLKDALGVQKKTPIKPTVKREPGANMKILNSHISAWE